MTSIRGSVIDDGFARVDIPGVFIGPGVVRVVDGRRTITVAAPARADVTLTPKERLMLLASGEALPTAPVLPAAGTVDGEPVTIRERKVSDYGEHVWILIAD